MTDWEEVLQEIKAELLRCSQKLGTGEILPNAIRVRLAKTSFEPWAPVLSEVTAEVGEALFDWAADRGSTWHEDCGPLIDVILIDGEPEIAVFFSGKESSTTTAVAVPEQ